MKPHNKDHTEEDISVSVPWKLSYELSTDNFVSYINKENNRNRTQKNLLSLLGYEMNTSTFLIDNTSNTNTVDRKINSATNTYTLKDHQQLEIIHNPFS
jgi:hypothetical protein